MIILYRGAGIAVVLVTLGLMGVAQLLFREAYENDQWPLGVAFLAAGGVLLPVGLWLNWPKKMFVPMTDEFVRALFPGQQVECEVIVPGGQHVLYGVRMELWAVALLIGGLVLVLG
jgi:hypothetical protein